MATKNTDSNALQIIEEKATGMIAKVRAVAVNTQEELNTVSDMIAQVKKLARYIEDEKNKFTEPAKAIIASAKEKYDPYLTKCKEAETTLKTKAQVFMIAEPKREEAEKSQDREEG